MAWLFLLFAGVLEIIWASAMKQSDGFTKLGYSVVTIAGMIASIIFLSISMKSLPLGTTYTVWTGIGAVGAFLVGIFILGEPADLMRLIAAVFIVIGILMMKLAS